MPTPTDPPAPGEPFRKLAAELYTADDLAALLNVSKRQVWRMEADGRLPAAVRMGKLTRWPRRTVDRWLSENCPKQRRTANR